MKFGEIFDNEEMSAEDKLVEINKIIAMARQNYGNVDIVIDEPEVNTADGVFNLSMVSAKGKVDLAASIYRDAKLYANEASKQQGVLADKAVEAFLATHPIAVNLSKTTESKYL